MSEETKGGLRFDGTISVPTLVAAVGVAGSFIWSSINATSQIVEIKGDIKEMRSDLSAIKTNQTAIPSMMKIDEDHEKRIRELEARIKWNGASGSRWEAGPFGGYSGDDIRKHVWPGLVPIRLYASQSGG